MAETVDLVVEDRRWTGTGLERIAPRAVAAALEAVGVGADVEISILACSDADIATLNSRFRGKSNATNVLSWPALNLFPDRPGGVPSVDIQADAFGETSLGDIAIAYETVVAEAQDGGISLDHHIFHLILHAALHLLGYDHQTDADAALMEGLEVRTLEKAGIASPYE